MIYYILTIAYAFLVPEVLCEILFDMTYKFNSTRIPIPIIALILVIVFTSMMLYGYIIMVKKKHPDKPNSMMGVYLPVFFPLLWYLICSGIFNLKNHQPTFTLIIQLSSVVHNFFGTTISMQNGLKPWHSVLFLNLLYYAVLILGFTVGERLSARKKKISRKPFKCHGKIMITAVTIFLLAYGSTELVLYNKYLVNIIPTTDPSYGFAYERMYSLVDMEFYYEDYDVKNEENILAKLDEPCDFKIVNLKDMPIMAGAQVVYPIYAAFGNACYEDITNIQANYLISASDTDYAYERLLDGKIDIFFGSMPSNEQLQIARQTEKELVITPIAKDALVFYVSEENPIDGLSSEQLRNIYSGKIKNWKKVGGINKKIHAFQRPYYSDSQTMMEYFMGDIPLKKPLISTRIMYDLDGDFGSGHYVASYQNSETSLGYSFRYYATLMINEVANDDGEEGSSAIKFLAVDGVYPDTETIRSGEYPLTTQLYAITVIDSQTGKYSKDTIEPFLEWMTGPQGQKLVTDTGYVSLE